MAWDRVSKRYREFPKVACDVLAAHTPPDELGFWAVMGSTVNSSELCRQVDKEATFGDPPITVFRARDFYIDVLVWMDGSTSIHQHGFGGAFRVLRGASLHSTYGFEERDRVTHRLARGDLSVHKSEVLREGATVAISPGQEGLIHGLYHIYPASMTIVARTYGEDCGSPQFNYLRPGIAYDPGAIDHELQRRLLVIRAANEVSHERSLALACGLVRKGDVWEGFEICRQWLAMIGLDGFEELSEQFLDRNPEWDTEFAAAFRACAKEARLSRLRKHAANEEEGIVLAVMLHLGRISADSTLLAELLPEAVRQAAIRRVIQELCMDTAA